ncbi:WXG100 family type VII secretion target [Nocardia farcinica]|uniref:WXG100 family type VII secretion target n=1 Tax=Nocardia TaxID=1817 RepID=UPI000BF1A5A4|nr:MULTISPECIES: WXG100 family type VII secretion target [Nocardia]MBF6188935.1 WXG100 family type VII secretion target [Nocardia farcinica]MBF6254481.1 WXG100 family type VII secretion target [Nocardia farcinica]MBF6262503.1 WXG100 family type VII secretion target [Nocardia farcinica]MBF6284351.1 WXG100 family type VII secretion target [Nocardia farcinica]MBF6294553.1 WXG100 family type VII secretion target [Nocardia farcinica]
MSGDLHVDVVQLREAARFIDDKARAIRSEVQQLDQSIGNELLIDGWQGVAASAYDESWVEWKQGAEAVISALEESAVALIEAANQYELRDETNSAAITGLTGLDLP